MHPFFHVIISPVFQLCAVSIVNCQLGATESCQCDCGASDNTPLEKPNDDDVLGPNCLLDCSDTILKAIAGRCLLRYNFACVEEVLKVKSPKCTVCICEVYPYFTECLRQYFD